MSMSNYANRIIVVNNDFVEETCKEELKALMALLEKNGITLFELADDVNYDNTSYPEEVYEALTAVYEKFGEKTLLNLFLDCHEAEETGDEVDGAFWGLFEEEVFTLTSSAKAIEGNFKVANFVTWG